MSGWGQGAGPRELVPSWRRAGTWPVLCYPTPGWGQGKQLHKACKKWPRPRYRAKPSRQPSAWQTTQGCPSGNEWHPPASRSTQNRECSPEEMRHGHKHQPVPRQAALQPSQPPHLLAGCSDATATREDGSVGSCVQGVCDEQDDRRFPSQGLTTFPTRLRPRPLHAQPFAYLGESVLSLLLASVGTGMLQRPQERVEGDYRLPTATCTLLALEIRHATSTSIPWDCADLQQMDRRLAVGIRPSVCQQRGIMPITSIRMWTRRNPISAGTWEQGLLGCQDSPQKPLETEGQGSWSIPPILQGMRGEGNICVAGVRHEHAEKRPSHVAPW